MSRRARIPVFIVLLLVLTAAVFAQVRGFSFLEYDDPDYVTANHVVRRGLSWEGVRWAFTTFHAGNWHPLTWLSHMCDTTLFGLDPAGHHLHNLFLHLLTGTALFLVLLALTGESWPSWSVAALFALHPLHVEPVAWVSERKEVLSAFLGVAALAAWLRYARRPSTGRYVFVGLLLALALMAKPMAVTLPVLFLLIDLWPLGRLRVRTAAALIAEKVPLLTLSAIAAVVTFLAQDVVGALQPNARLSLAARAANAAVVPFVYLRRALYPADLNVFYPHRGEAYSLVALAGGLFAIAGVTAVVAAGFRRRPFLLVGWLWYLIALFPVSGLIQAGNQSSADRYTYVPLTGIFIAGAWAVHAGRVRGAARGLVLAGTCAALLVLGAAASRQAGYWRDEITLFSRALAIRPEDPDAHSHLGSALLSAGRIAAALPHLRAALRLCPQCPENPAKLADALAAQGAWGEAVGHYRHSLQLDSGRSGVWNNLGVALVRLGNREEARECFLRAKDLDPDNPEAWNNIGNLQAAEGAVSEALSQFERALAIDPGHWRARANRAAALRRFGRTAEALEEYRAVLRLRPGYTPAPP